MMAIKHHHLLSAEIVFLLRCVLVSSGTKSRYVDVLNPSRTIKASGGAPPPGDIFAPLAPMPMPANLFVPSSGV